MSRELNSHYAANSDGSSARQAPINRPEAGKNRGDNVLDGIPSGDDEPSLVRRYLASADLSTNTRAAIRYDLRKAASWFVDANKEPFRVGRMTVRDIADLRDHLRRDKGQAVSTVNRMLVTLRGLFGWLETEGVVTANPAAAIKELRRQPLAPKGLERAEVRRLLREVELRGDLRARALFTLMLTTGARLGDAAQLELADLLIGERGGHVIFRCGKGNKERTVPLNRVAREALTAYLEVRPPIASRRVFVGERGEMTGKGIDKIFRRYAAICGIERLHAHRLRHSFCHHFLADSGNDLVALAQICGHESLDTTKRYVIRGQEQLAEAVERLTM